MFFFWFALLCVNSDSSVLQLSQFADKTLADVGKKSTLQGKVGKPLTDSQLRSLVYFETRELVGNIYLDRLGLEAFRVVLTRETSSLDQLHIKTI